MKSIHGNNTEPQWSSSLPDDLVFIKKHLRYPVSKKTLPSIAVVLLFLFGLSRFLLPVVFTGGRNPAIEWIFLSFAVLAVAGAFYRYLATLRFASIITPFSADENRQLVDKFIRSQQLALFTHPSAPEVFQIVSTPIGDPAKDQREVMIFIADNQRILINSHFTNQRLALTFSSGNYKMMAARLREWVRKHYPDHKLLTK